MLFNSLEFFLFLPLTVIFYYLLPHKFRWILLLIASCVFYMAFVPKYILILFAIILIDYMAAIVIEDTDSEKKKRKWLAFSLLSNLALLAFFKYFNFANENLTWFAAKLGHGNPIPFLNIILPIGLSFHTFQSMGYTIDVYYKKQKAERHLGYYSLYVLFFPQMVAGPIERFKNLGEQLKQKVELNYENLSQGFRFVLYGLFVKMVVADNVGEYVNQVYAEPSRFNYLSLATAVVFYSFQIYADFFGYSTIAIGCARLLGIKMMDNFRNPYFSRNLAEFWERWHISLSTWFRDYLYIPLGGSKVSTLKWCFNIMAVFVLSGLWHGASWNFIFWGTIHGVVYLIEKGIARVLKLKEVTNPALKAILILKNFIVVTLIWIFFRSDSFDTTKLVFKQLFFLQPAGEELLHVNFLNVLIPLFVFVITDALLLNSSIGDYLDKKPVVFRWSLYAVLIIAIMLISGLDTQPFIYFQF